MTSNASKPIQQLGNGSDESKREANLYDDLEDVLHDLLEAQGSYAYSSLLPFAPLACPNIQGLGNIGLPLAETDAKRIIACASKASYPQGCNIWEIDSAHIKFGNPNWFTYVQDLALRTVCSGLDLNHYSTPPRCELHKLLIYEPGSRILPHNETKEADQMFATMIILLPSQYTGGEIHLTHASERQVIDFSASSLVNTAVLAWYTDVIREVKPITSGYRLALSYNLIHTSLHTPLPLPPKANDSPCANLRRVLCDWENAKYQEPKGRNCIAYSLARNYSSADFRRGALCLKGDDDTRISLLRAATEGLGFTIFFASLRYKVSAYSEDPCDDDWPKCGCEYGMYQMDNMKKDIFVFLSDVVDLDGDLVSRHVGIDKDCFLPRHTIDHENIPDGMQRTGYTGSDDAQFEYWYDHSVFVLVKSDQVPRILAQDGELKYVMKIRAIGEKNAETIMGGRYADVRKAIKGEAAFCLDEMEKNVAPNIGEKRKRGLSS